MRFLLYFILLSSFSISAQTMDWVRGMGGPDNEFANAMALDSSGNVYITGAFRGTVDFDPDPSSTYILSSHNNSFDVFIQKFDAQGNFISAWRVGGNADDYANDIAFEPNVGLIVVGSFSDTADFNPHLQDVHNVVSEGFTDGFILHISTSGNYQYVTRLGGIGFDKVLKVKTYNFEEYYVGQFQDTLEFANFGILSQLVCDGNDDVFVVKFDSDNAYDWSARYGAYNVDLVSDFDVKNGMIFIGGTFKGTIKISGTFITIPETIAIAPNYVGYIIKMNIFGTLIWTRLLQSQINANVSAISINSNDEVIAGGWFMATTDFDPSSATQYNITSNQNGQDAFVLKLAPDGSFVWAKSFGATSSDNVVDIAIDNSNNIYTTGHFLLSCDFDPGPGNTTLTSESLGDTYLQKLNDAGDFQGLLSFGGYLNQFSTAIYAYENKIYNLGTFQDSVDFDPTSNQEILVANGTYSDIYLWKGEFDDLVGIQQLSYENSDFAIYPNPSSGNFTISLNNECENCSYEVFDMLGRSVQDSKPIIGINEYVSIEHSGLHNLIVRQNEQIISQKRILVNH